MIINLLGCRINYMSIAYHIDNTNNMSLHLPSTESQRAPRRFYEKAHKEIYSIDFGVRSDCSRVPFFVPSPSRFFPD